MHIVHVFIKVKPDMVEAFKKATIDNADNSRKEPGIARFDFIQQADDSTRFCLVEVYRTAEAPGQHKETAHYKKWAETVTDMLAEPRSRTVYANVFPTDAEW
jgi:(4S)-4-hydroxy-5-phosphonooxypentane-2,3-dione isomerase